MQQFDPNLFNNNNPPDPLMQGEVTAVTVIEPGGVVAGLTNHVIDPRKSFTVKVDWTIFGGLVPLWIQALDPNGTNDWSVDLYAESLGGGPEINLGRVNVPTGTFTANAALLLGRDYTGDVVVAPNTLDEGDPGSNTSGVYKLAAVVFLDSRLGRLGYDLAGFSEGPIIEAENLD